MKKISIYVHIPFCVSKCGYCDFLSFAGLSDRHEAYVSALVSEINAARHEFADAEITSVFFGGGTPTALPSRQIARVLNAIRNGSAVEEDAEITTEANPETVSEESLRELKQAGVNRLSIGVQSFDDVILRRIGRAHNAETARDAYAMACEAGFGNISLDLMFSLPGQVPETFEKSLQTALDLSPEHISCYGLTIEPDTPIGREHFTIDEEADRAMYAAAKRVLTDAGYEHYEISNFALPGYASRHNLAYWTGGEYRGFGLGAHSYINGTRFHNEPRLDEYIKNNGKLTRLDPEILNENDLQSEFMFLGLRLLRGINCADFAQRFGKNIYTVYGSQIRELLDMGLLAEENGRVFLTPKGIDVSNQVFVRFV